MAQLSPRIVAKIKQIPDVAVDAARQAMEEVAQEIVEAMRAAAPKGKTGRLRDSIGWTWGEVPAGSLMIDEIRSGKNKGDQYATLRIKIYAGNKIPVQVGTEGDTLGGFRQVVVKRTSAGTVAALVV